MKDTVKNTIIFYVNYPFVEICAAKVKSRAKAVNTLLKIIGISSPLATTGEAFGFKGKYNGERPYTV
jgi:hypothetical protein